MFNFAKAIEAGKKQASIKKLSLLLIGSSGSGKSGTIGTIGVPTLYLYTTGEKHGVVSAMSFGKDIIPVQFDVNPETGELLTPDGALANLQTILNDVEGIKKLKVGCVAVDGCAEIENLILNSTKWEALVKQQYKGVAAYAGPVTLSLFRPILRQLTKLQSELDIHYIVTAMLFVRELDDETGAIIDAAPSMQGFQVATGILQQFDDILILGQMRNKEGKSVPRFQFEAKLQRDTKDQNTKEVRKILNLSNRITGCDITSFPGHCKNDLKMIAKAKIDGKYIKPEKKAN